MKRTSTKAMTIFDVVRETNPKIVVMPILMMFFSLLGCIPYFLNEKLNMIRIGLFGFILIMFWFIPTTTLPFVLKNFKGKRKSNLLKRMLITSLPGILLIIGFFTAWRYEILLTYGFLGFLYFLFDYITQGKLSIFIRIKPEILDSHSFIEKTMNTKCSRSVLWEHTRGMKNLKRKKEVRRRMKATGVRWWHLHPMTPKSLTEIIFPFMTKIL